MKSLPAILLTLALFLICGALIALTHFNLWPLLFVATSIWVAVDSSRVRLTSYQPGISYSPLVLGILCSSFWIVAFPWYLSMRHKILTGTAHLRPEHEPWDMARGQMSPNGLIQPWRGRPI